MSDIQINLSAKDAQMVAAWQRAKESVAAFSEKVEEAAQKHEKLGHAGKVSFESIGSGITGVIGRVGGLFAGFAGVKTVVEGIVEGCKHIQDEAKKAAEKVQEAKDALMKDLNK